MLGGAAVSLALLECGRVPVGGKKVQRRSNGQAVGEKSFSTNCCKRCATQVKHLD